MIFFPEALQYAHQKAPNKNVDLKQTYGKDSEVPVWKDDAWYWKKKPRIGVMIGEKKKKIFTKYHR